MSAIRIVLADDHPLFREGVAKALSEDPELAVVGQAEDADGAVRLARSLSPDLVLLDVSMPGGGLAALRRVRALPDPPAAAMLTVSEDDDDILDALRAGASGYILKGVGAAELIEAVKDICAGRSWVSSAVARRISGEMARPAGPSPVDALTRREEDILRLVAQGLSNREVGEALGLQEKTVKHYMTSILQKLHARNRVEAAMMARERWPDG
ncbi:response regulator [Oceanicella actignis]|uniref:DNA-binding response regulator, NarL/FixJ family, contains REC and HTH domains n=1 Tax=Oceanicella actignis TaxID=1189325 RepID=A0A1M7T2U0_9RHOB|nr:response regulator transcription factor [Oceanicella actignis]SET39314.1 two component transcriptional regulator, LuxR family [Oceanicella actignis]SHN64987.1 DNA-binding response regulator, NarL/FixJ family, contains REC and HTH domains [Oceanicella actignis]